MKKYLYLDQLNDGDMLYHYTKCYAAANILKTSTMFATKSSFLNDTNEMAYILHVAQEVIEDLPSRKWQRLLMNEIIDTMEDFRRHDNYVLSFSEEKDSITLWSEFGEETGYNLSFDGKELIDCIGRNQKIYCHGRVIYSHEKQYGLLKELFLRIIPAKIGKSFEDILAEELSSSGTDAFAQLCRKLRSALNVYAMFFKQPEFQSEKEYRMVFRKADRQDIRFRIKEGFLLPYIEVNLMGDAPLPVRQITVAPKNHVDLARKGMLLYTQSLGYEVPVTLSKLKLRY